MYIVHCACFESKFESYVYVYMRVRVQVYIFVPTDMWFLPVTFTGFNLNHENKRNEHECKRREKKTEHEQRKYNMQ